MPRILLVDDDIAEISAVKRVLAKSGLTPVLATNASDARVAVAHRRPDMLIVGATCENGEAVALAVQLAGKPSTRDLPIIVLGASDAAPPRAVVLARPVDPFALSEQVVDLLARPKAPAEPPSPQGPVLERVEYRAPRQAVIVPEYLEAAEADLTPIEEPLLEPPPLEPALLEEPSADRPALERRGPPISLPRALERRAAPSDPARARQAAIEALRARAEELRRGPEASGDPAPAEAAAGLDALFELQPPAGVEAGDGPAAETTAPDEVAELDPAWLLPSDEVTPVTPLSLAPALVERSDDFSGLFDEVEPAPDGAAATAGGPGLELEPPQGVTTTLSEGAGAGPTGADEPRGPTGTLPGFAAPGAPRSRRMVDELEAQARAQAALEDEVQARRAREAEAQAQAWAAEAAEAEARRARDAEAAALARARAESAALERARAEARTLADQEAAQARRAALAEANQARQAIEAEAEQVRRVAEAEAARARQAAGLEAERARQAEERAAAEAERARQAEERLRTEAAARAEALQRAGEEAERARRAEAAVQAEIEAATRQVQAAAQREAEAAARRAQEAAQRELEAATRQAQEAAQREAEAATRQAQAAARRELEAASRRAQEAEVLLRAASLASDEASRLAEVEGQRAHLAEERLRAEAAARAEALQHAGEEAARARQAEQATQRETEARRLLESEVERLRAQREADQAAHLAELERARAGAAEEAARLEARQAEAQRLAVDAAAEQAASRAASDAEARTRQALEAAQARLEAETTARAVAEEARQHAEATLRRLAEERLAAEAAGPSQGAARTAERPPPRPARMSDPAAAPWPEAPPAWTEPYAPSGEAPPPEPLPVPAEDEPLPLPPAELRAGHLDDLAFPRWLWLASRAQVTGRLDVSGEAARSLWFEAGRLMGAASNVPAERIEEVALRLGLLTREQHRAIAGPAAALPPRRAAVLLVERGYLKPAELTGLVRRRTEEVAFGIFSEAGARFRWAPDPVPPDERVAPERPLLALALEGVRRRWQTPRLEAVLGGPDTLLAAAPGGPDDALVGLLADDRRCLALADGLRTVDELVASSPLDPLSTRQLLAFAVLVKRLEPRLVQTGRPRGQVAAAIDLARLQAKLEQVRRDDYFTILGLGRLCTPHEVREAADRILDDLSPERFAARRDEGITGKVQEIQQVVAEARAVLVDDGLRSEYLKGIGG